MESWGVGTSEVVIASFNGRSTFCPSERTASFEDFTGDQMYVKFNELAKMPKNLEVTAHPILVYSVHSESVFVFLILCVIY